MSRDDTARVQHALAAARDAIAFCRGKKQADLETDRMLRRALLQCFAEIGEALNHLSPTTKATMPQVPWHAIVAMRNAVVHVYFDVNLEVVWKTVHDDLPPLIDALQSHLNRSAR